MPDDLRGPWPTLDPAALYGLAGDVVRAFEPHSESDPAALLISFLTAFGNATGPRPHAYADGADHPPRLFSVIVGDSSRARKGTSWRNVRQLFEIADTQWTDQCVSGGLASGEGMVAPIADPNSEKRLLCIEEEFARTLAVGSRGNSTLPTLIRQAWDDGNLRILTKKPTTVTNGHISVLAHATIQEIDARLSYLHRVSGFANRFLFVCAKRRNLLPQGGKALEDHVIRALSIRTIDALDDARSRDLIRRTPAAERLWDTLYREMANDLPPGSIGPLVARSEAQALRLSLLYALVDQSPVIDVQHLRAAAALWAYSRASIDTIFGFGDPLLNLLYDKLAGAPQGLTHTEQNDAFGGHVSRQRLDQARTYLQSRGLIVDETRPASERGGPRTRVTRVV